MSKLTELNRLALVWAEAEQDYGFASGMAFARKFETESVATFHEARVEARRQYWNALDALTNGSK